jgi:hypothetical protein
MRARSRVLLSARARWLAQRSTVAACGATRAAKRSSALVEPTVPVATEDWSYHLRLGPAREATILIACLAALSLGIKYAGSYVPRDGAGLLALNCDMRDGSALR